MRTDALSLSFALVACGSAQAPVAVPAPQAEVETVDAPEPSADATEASSTSDVGTSAIVTLGGPAPTGRVDETDPIVAGPLAAPDIGRRVHRHINEVRYCYERRLEALPGIRGRVVVAFTIGAEGYVEGSRVTEDTVGDPQLATCITTAVDRWLFDAPPVGTRVSVTYPFVLAPVGTP